MAKYIVQLRDEGQLQNCSELLQDQQKHFQELTSLGALTVNADNRQEIYHLLRSSSQIQRITEDIEVKLIEDETIETQLRPSLPWGIKHIGASFSYIPQRYSRPKVGILDTGLSLHPRFNVRGQYVNFTDERSPIDSNGHGTHIAGTIGGFSRQRSQSFHGVYPQLALYSIKAFNKDGSASLSSILSGIDWAIRQNIRILNMSFGLDDHIPALHDAVRRAAANDIVMVAASGNKGTPTVSFPAQYPEVIAVGSINRDAEVSSFSQYGNSLDLLAPGEEIVSTWIQKSYRSISGTSMACGHVSGAAAIVLALKPEFTAQEVKDILFEQAQELSTPSYLRQGNGVISVRHIVSALR
ncbi:S8 family peptidase [Caldalkalibacillus salinus]|uniref:S8 family peptidase n=1 Tax=Caldalkalibacillus salinus TaxID=2803787 RepID=UPI001924EFF7|nr:S8 family peptidase [Caldalkalibacillus salinus]